MKEIVEAVCSYEKVREHLKSQPEDLKKVEKIVAEIRGAYSESIVGAAASFIDKTFLRLYNGVNLKMPENFDIREFQKNYHLILVPNHQSHADYIALQYILYKHGKIPVYIAAGINLNIFPVGKLFRKSGAFFIRRKFDDELYKITFQGYIYYLLKTDKVVEFFFEGGRTRTGKLLPPKYGLFSMLLDAHKKFDEKKPLMFIPVSLAHEMIPEERAHAKELSGRKKEKESTTQLFKLFKLFNKKLGTVHVRFGKGIVVEDYDDLKQTTQELAFDCFRAVGKGMPITPTSLLALVLLDEAHGALTWKQILRRAKEVIDYCHYMDIPYAESLASSELEASLKVSMDIFINNKKIRLIKREKLNQVFYTIVEESRIHLLYHKNMILHHFLVPGIISSTWLNIFNGQISNEADLLKFQLGKRKELKHEFYLPRVKEMIEETLKVIKYATGLEVSSLAEALKMSSQDLYRLAQKVNPFATAFSYIYESYYLGAITLKFLGEESFLEEKYFQVAKELFDLEIEHGRVIKYPESFSVPNLRSTLRFFIEKKVLSQEKDFYKINSGADIDYFVEKFAKDINDHISINIKFSRDR